jgi:hypothetical protein
VTSEHIGIGYKIWRQARSLQRLEVIFDFVKKRFGKGLKLFKNELIELR